MINNGWSLMRWSGEKGVAGVSLTSRVLRRAVADGVLLALVVGAFLGADWGAAIAAMIDSRSDRLSRPGELVVSAALALLGGAAGLWFARARN